MGIKQCLITFITYPSGSQIYTKRQTEDTCKFLKRMFRLFLRNLPNRDIIHYVWLFYIKPSMVYSKNGVFHSEHYGIVWIWTARSALVAICQFWQFWMTPKINKSCGTKRHHKAILKKKKHGAFLSSSRKIILECTS